MNCWSFIQATNGIMDTPPNHQILNKINQHKYGNTFTIMTTVISHYSQFCIKILKKDHTNSKLKNAQMSQAHVTFTATPISWYPCLMVNMDVQVKGCFHSNSFGHTTRSYRRNSKPNFAL